MTKLFVDCLKCLNIEYRILKVQWTWLMVMYASCNTIWQKKSIVELIIKWVMANYNCNLSNHAHFTLNIHTYCFDQIITGRKKSHPTNCYERFPVRSPGKFKSSRTASAKCSFQPTPHPKRKRKYKWASTGKDVFRFCNFFFLALGF